MNSRYIQIFNNFRFLKFIKNMVDYLRYVNICVGRWYNTNQRSEGSLRNNVNGKDAHFCYIQCLQNYTKMG